MKALFNIKGYIAVIPKIQNIYSPEKVETGYEFGFKYDSGVFEYFTFKEQAIANMEYDSLITAVENFWSKKMKP